MISKKDLIIVALATFCLTATLFMILPTRSNPSMNEYDPSQENVSAFSSSNFFPDWSKLVLQGAFINDVDGSRRGILLEQDLLARLNTLPSDIKQLANGTYGWTTLYSIVFTHEELPVYAYNISGDVLGTLTLHVHMSGSGYDYFYIKGMVNFGEVLTNSTFKAKQGKSINQFHYDAYRDGQDPVLSLTYDLPINTPVSMPTTSRIGVQVQIQVAWRFQYRDSGYFEFLTNKSRTDFSVIVPTTYR